MDSPAPIHRLQQTKTRDSAAENPPDTTGATTLAHSRSRRRLTQYENVFRATFVSSEEEDQTKVCGEKLELIGRVFHYDDESGVRYRRYTNKTSEDIENAHVGREKDDCEIETEEIDLGYREKAFIDYCITMLTDGTDKKNLGQSMTN